MHFEKTIEIDAPQQRVWDVLSDLEAWPPRIETVDVVELLTPAPITKGSRVRLKQPKLPEGTWDITVWDAPSYFEWTQKTGGITEAFVADGMPFTSFSVNDAKAEFERLQARGVRFTQEPTEMGPVTTAVFDDTCGMIQIASQPGS